jgi:hypothetical protein
MAGSYGSDEQYRLAPPPPDVTQPVSVAQGYGARDHRGRDYGGGYASRGASALDEAAPEQYRLSEPPAPVSPPVAVAQGAGARPPRRARQMAVVEIASAIAGAAMTRILENEGDVNWELDQLNGVLHPDSASASPSGAAYQSKRVAVPGLWVENGFTDRITADFEITFQYNGASVGYIQVSNTGTNDAVGWSLTVKENIMPDPNTYTTVPASASRFAAIKVRFHYRFARSVGSDSIGIKEFTLYGNGNVAEDTRWTQT